MMNIKTFIWLCVLFTFLLFSCSPSASTWNEKVKEQKAEKGWLPILEQFNGKRIAFIHIYSTQKIQDGIYSVKILWANHESIAGGYPEDIFRIIEDCVKNKSALIDSGLPLESIDLLSLKWRSVEGDQLHPILCESLIKL